MNFKTAEIFASVNEDITNIFLDNYSLTKNMQIELYNVLNIKEVYKLYPNNFNKFDLSTGLEPLYLS